MISIFQHPSSVDMTQNMKKTTIERRRCRKNNMMKFSMIQMIPPVGGRRLMRVDWFNVIIDALVVELNRRKQVYVEVSKMFGFLRRLNVMDINAIAQRSGELVSRYTGDLDTTLTDECLQLWHYIAQSDSQQFESDSRQLVSNLNPITLHI